MPKRPTLGEKPRKKFISGKEAKEMWNRVYSFDSIGQRYHYHDEPLKHIKPGQTVIDVGGGPGITHREIQNRIGKNGLLVNLDASDEILRTYKRRGALAGLKRNPVNATLPGSPIKPESADHVLAIETMQYLPDGALIEMINMAKPGGQVHFSFVAKNSITRPSDIIRAFTPSDVSGFLESSGIPKANIEIKPAFRAGDNHPSAVEQKFAQLHPEIPENQIKQHPKFKKFKDEVLVHWVRIKKPKGWKPRE